MRTAKKNLQNLDPLVYTKKGTLRRRKQKVSRNYFTQDTQDAVVSYNNSSDEEERNILFNTRINYGLHKLAENIINTFKFDYRDVDTTEDLKHEVVFFLLTKFPLYNPEKGKAYSYFGTIAKNYLTVYNNKNYELQKKRKEMDHVDEDKKILMATQEGETDSEISHFVKSFVRFVELNIEDIHETRVVKDGVMIKDYVVFSEKDKAIVYTVLDLFKRSDELPVFYKPAIYLQIREVTGQKTLDITRVIRILKCIMQQQLNIYYKKGALDIDETDIYSNISI